MNLARQGGGGHRRRRRDRPLDRAAARRRRRARRRARHPLGDRPEEHRARGRGGPGGRLRRQRQRVRGRGDRAVEAELGPVDILVNNAGAIGMDHLRRVKPLVARQREEALNGGVKTPLDALVRLTDEEWRRMLAIHLDGTFYCTRAAVRYMAPRGRGVVVNMSSICGLEGCTGHPHYSAAKAAILGFTKAAAKELIVQGIRVNAVAPGHVGTNTLQGEISEERAGARELHAGRPARRAGGDRRDRRVPRLRRRELLRRPDPEPERRARHGLSSRLSTLPAALRGSSVDEVDRGRLLVARELLAAVLDQLGRRRLRRPRTRSASRPSAGAGRRPRRRR